MQYIMEHDHRALHPLKHHGAINGRSVAITRDDSAYELHFDKEVSLIIYDRHEKL